MKRLNLLPIAFLLIFIACGGCENSEPTADELTSAMNRHTKKSEEAREKVKKFRDRGHHMLEIGAFEEHYRYKISLDSLYAVWEEINAEDYHDYLFNEINAKTSLKVEIDKNESRDAYELSLLILNNDAPDAKWLGLAANQAGDLVKSIVSECDSFITDNPKTFVAISVSIEMNLKYDKYFKKGFKSHNKRQKEFFERMEYGVVLEKPTEELLGWCQISLNGEAINADGLPGNVNGFFAFNYAAYVEALKKGEVEHEMDYIFRILKGPDYKLPTEHKQ